VNERRERNAIMHDHSILLDSWERSLLCLRVSSALSKNVLCPVNHHDGGDGVN